MELDQLQSKIVELLPTNIARRLVETNKRGSGPGGGGTRRGGMWGGGLLRQGTEPPRRWLHTCEGYQAVVLQLDLCRFTVLSQTLEPIQVIVHPLSFRWPMVRNFPFSLFP